MTLPTERNVTTQVELNDAVASKQNITVGNLEEIYDDSHKNLKVFKKEQARQLDPAV